MWSVRTLRWNVNGNVQYFRVSFNGRTQRSRASQTTVLIATAIAETFKTSDTLDTKTCNDALSYEKMRLNGYFA